MFRVPGTEAESRLGSSRGRDEGFPNVSEMSLASCPRDPAVPETQLGYPRSVLLGEVSPHELTSVEAERTRLRRAPSLPEHADHAWVDRWLLRFDPHSWSV